MSEKYTTGALVAIAVEGVSCLVFHFFFDAGIAILPY